MSTILLTNSGDKGQDYRIEDLRRDRADLLEGDAPLGIDYEGFRNPVDSPVDRHPAIDVGAG